jgi:hypothetical protein
MVFEEFDVHVVHAKIVLSTALVVCKYSLIASWLVRPFA